MKKVIIGFNVFAVLVLLAVVTIMLVGNGQLYEGKSNTEDNNVQESINEQESTDTKECNQDVVQNTPAEYVSYNCDVSKPVDYTFNEAVDVLKNRAWQDEKYQTIINTPERYPEQLLINLANNPEMLDFVHDYDINNISNSNEKLSEQELQEKCPLFLQWDKRWGYQSYGDDSNIAVSGCGPTSLAMAAVALTHDESVTPAVIADYAMRKDYYQDGVGTRWSLMTEGAAHFGLQSDNIRLNQQKMKNVLDAGGLLIISVRKGQFTTGGHFMVIYGYDKKNFMINDPNCVKRSKTQWTYEQLYKEIKSVWALYKAEG